MKIYGLTPANFFAAIVIGLVISFVAVTLFASSNQEVKSNPTSIPIVQLQPTPYYLNNGNINMMFLKEMMVAMWYWMVPLFIITFVIGLIASKLTRKEYY